jgi:Asp-tRNA(Asn)/Glu-tRNA(Gln) amidotransferase A subunit family amidase
VLGIPDARFLREAGEDARQAFQDHLTILRDAGFQLRHSTVLSDFDELADCMFTINRWELARTHRSWFERHESRYRPETAAAIRQGLKIAPEDYAGAMRWKHDFTTRLARAGEDAGVDVWVTPAATQTAPAGLDSTGNSVMGFPFSLAGVPALSVPAGCDRDGLPWGLQCAGWAGEDELLLAFSAAVEQALGRQS